MEHTHIRQAFTLLVDGVREAVQKEFEGPGKLLGYRAMHKKIRPEHNLLVSRDAV
jgi:hypothetical protein